jgi:hypothetical protein
MPHLTRPLAEFLGNSLGIAAVLLVAGWLAIRWQQDRQRFQLMQTALEKGITRFPDAPPFWLVSMRQALTMLALGVSLVLVGGGALWVGRQTPMPSTANLQFHSEPRPDQDFAPNSPPDSRSPDARPRDNNRPPRPGERIDQRPDGRPDFNGPIRHPAPPAPNPEMERWHQAQVEQTGGLVSIGIGIILAFVGVVRVVFAQAERQYTLSRASQESTF